MTAEKSFAIVLRVVEFSETSLIVTLYTEQHGRVSALAKGAQRPKSPFESALDLLSLSRVVFLRKSGDALDLLTEAKLERRFRAAARSLPRLYAGLYVAELLAAWTTDGDTNSELFHLANNTLARLDGDASVPLTLLHFEIRGLHLIGQLPALDDCVGCGARVDPMRRTSFGLIAGGVLCTACKPGHRQVISISQPARSLFGKLAKTTEPTSQLHADGAKSLGEVRGIMNQVVAHQLERRPRLAPWIARYCHGGEVRSKSRSARTT